MTISENLSEQNQISGYNSGIDAMTKMALQSGIIRSDEQAGMILNLQEKIKKQNIDSSGIDSHMAFMLFALPAGILSLISMTFSAIEAMSTRSKIPIIHQKNGISEVGADY
jgi:hypothetical protein